jgi:hypothetical protein
MANKITWADKVALQEKPDVVAENKVTAADMNQIKTAVNETIDTMPSNLVNGQARGSIRSIGSYDTTINPLGPYAQAFGSGTIASGEYSHAEGAGPKASGAASHAEGYSTTASGQTSHAEGNRTEASSPNSHAEGDNTNASGESSHAEGYHTKALGYYSHAEGAYTEVSGSYSHAEGYQIKASGNFQHVQGKYNIEDTTSAHIVGNGSISVRSNAHTLDWNGNAWFAGDVYTGSTSGTNKDDGSVKLPVVYSGTTAPTNDIGKNGDLYVLLDS